MAHHDAPDSPPVPPDEALLRRAAARVVSVLPVSEADVVSASAKLQAAVEKSQMRRGDIGVKGEGSQSQTLRRGIFSPQTLRQELFGTPVLSSGLKRPWRVLSQATIAGGIALAIFAGVRSRSITATSTYGYTTKPGQQSKVQLADGSSAVLGPATTMTVTLTPTGMHADVHGDVRFTVTPRPSMAFTVRAGYATTRVLGTVFAVRHYPDDRVARVMVADGRVALYGTIPGNNAQHQEILTANMVGVVDDSGQVRLLPAATLNDYTDWTTGRLVFKDTPMPEIIADLSRAYGADIRVTDSALRRRALTMTIPVSKQPLQSVLSVLADLIGAHITQAGPVISIVPGTSDGFKRTRGSSLFTVESNYGR